VTACASPVDAVVVRFDKKSGMFEEKRVANIDVAFSAFKAALYLWKVNKVELFQTRVEGPTATDLMEPSPDAVAAAAALTNSAPDAVTAASTV
jgi:hypothetical protein